MSRQVGMDDQVVRGAQICVAYWQAQGDESMVMDAQARLDRVLQGTANEVDIDGALDWLDISEDDYEAICEIASEHMAEDDEDLIAEISREWADYWEDEEWDSDSILTEDLITDIADLVAQGLSVSEAVVIVAQ